METKDKEYQDSVKEQIKELPKRWQEFFEKYWGQMLMSPAAINYHHNFAGGLMRHIYEMLNFAGPLASAAGIDQVSLIKVILLHDFAKIKTYGFTDGDMVQIEYKQVNYPVEFWTINELAKYDLSLTDDELNAIVMAEGGWSEYENIQTGRLATLLHMADLWSAKIICPRHSVDCPECKKPMKLRSSARGKFFGCSNYPACSGTVNLSEASLKPNENMKDDWNITALGGGAIEEKKVEVPY